MAVSKYPRLSLDEIDNTLCFKKCSKKQRQELTDEDLCNNAYSILDGLKVRCVGSWAIQKIYNLTQYFSTFAIAMHSHWPSINYIEICSGPGRCIDRINGVEFNGTPLSIIKTKGFDYINKALFFDYNQNVVDSLNERFQKRNVSPKAIALIGNYHTSSIIEKIKTNIPNDGLSLVFIDPTDLSISFELIKDLKNYLKNMDLIVNFAVGSDFNRNIKNILLREENYQNVFQKYCTFLGFEDFFTNDQILELAEAGKNQELRTLFRKAYQNSLKTLDFKEFDSVQVQNLYDLLYASKAKTGINLWKKSHSINYKGQRSLNF